LLFRKGYCSPFVRHSSRCRYCLPSSSSSLLVENGIILEWNLWRYRAVLVFSRKIEALLVASLPVQITRGGTLIRYCNDSKKQRSGNASRVVSMNVLSPEFMKILSSECDAKSFWRECRCAHGWAGDNVSPNYLGVIT
jgi:hypothetical protein